MKSPLVSVILPVYNGEKNLVESIESVLSQTFQDFELIIINDGSTDQTFDILKKYKNNQKIKIFHQDNIGLVKTLNKGLEIANGKYIARIDDDDLWCDLRKLEKQVKFLENNSEYILVGGGVITINNKKEQLFKFLKPETDKLIREKMLFKCPFAHSSVLFRKNGKLYNENNHFAEDWELWMELGRDGKLYNFQEYFIWYTISNENVSARHRLAQLQKGTVIIKQYKDNYPNYLKALTYSYIKIIFFAFPHSKILFQKFLSLKNKFNIFIL